jgi:hypothetical protein
MGSLPSLFLKPLGYPHYASVIKPNIKRFVPDRFQKFSSFAHSILPARSSALRWIYLANVISGIFIDMSKSTT